MGDVMSPTLLVKRSSRRAAAQTPTPRRSLTLDEFFAVCATIGQRPNPEQRTAIEASASAEENVADDGTYASCYARTFCPSYTGETRPLLPGIATA